MLSVTHANERGVEIRCRGFCAWERESGGGSGTPRCLTRSILPEHLYPGAIPSIKGCLGCKDTTALSIPQCPTCHSILFYKTSYLYLSRIHPVLPNKDALVDLPQPPFLFSWTGIIHPSPPPTHPNPPSHPPIHPQFTSSRANPPILADVLLKPFFLSSKGLPRAFAVQNVPDLISLKAYLYFTWSTEETKRVVEEKKCKKNKQTFSNDSLTKWRIY